MVVRPEFSIKDQPQEDCHFDGYYSTLAGAVQAHWHNKMSEVCRDGRHGRVGPGPRLPSARYRVSRLGLTS